MTPIFLTVGNNLPVMIIPNTKVHFDGHAVLTHTYSIFFDNSKIDPTHVYNKAAPSNDLNYYGYIKFEDPERLFSYTPEGRKQLTRDELEEIIERLKHYRNNPALWNQAKNP